MMGSPILKRPEYSKLFITGGFCGLIRGPTAILFILRHACGDSLAKLFHVCFLRGIGKYCAICSPCTPAEAHRWIFFWFWGGKYCRKFGGIFAGFFGPTKARLKQFRDKFRAFFVRTFVPWKKSSCKLRSADVPPERYVVQWVSLRCACLKLNCQEGGITPCRGTVNLPEKLSRDMGYRP